jgi:hypothetical protein
MTEKEDPGRQELRQCDELVESATADVLRATRSLEQLPETMGCDSEGDVRWRALNALYASFSKLHRAKGHAHRALYTPPPEMRLRPDDDFEPED